MKKILTSLCAVLGLFLAVPVLAASVSAYPTGPKTVAVGQTFNVYFEVNNAVDVDTIRLNGSYTQNLLQYKAAQPTGVFQNVSPGTYDDQTNGIFSFGAFTLSSKANGTQRIAVLTFKATQVGAAYVQLTQGSKILSAGNEELGSIGRLDINVTAAPPQPQAVPGQPAPIAISLLSASHPDSNAWYATGTVEAHWQITGPTPQAVYVGFDQAPDGPVTKNIQATSTTFEAPTDGVWYVHLLATYPGGKTQRADLPVQIDRGNPHAVTPTTDQTNVPASVANFLRYGTTDDVSGISHYDVYLDDALVTSTIFASYPVNGLQPGSHEARVIAYDFAGNLSMGTTTFNILQSFVPTTQAPPSNSLVLWLLALLVVAICVLIWVILARRKREVKKGRKK